MIMTRIRIRIMVTTVRTMNQEEGNEEKGHFTMMATIMMMMSQEEGER